MLAVKHFEQGNRTLIIGILFAMAIISGMIIQEISIRGYAPAVILFCVALSVMTIWKSKSMLHAFESVGVTAGIVLCSMNDQKLFMMGTSIMFLSFTVLTYIERKEY